MNKVSIIIPAYNEEKTILELLRRVKEAPLSFNKEIIVVDDCSKDKTIELLKNVEGIRVIPLNPNKGKGGALKAGIAAATGEVVVFQDADLEYDPRDIQRVIQPIFDGKTEISNGVRIESRLNEGDKFVVGFLGWLGNNTITWTTNILYQNKAREYEGCYKAFKRELLQSVEIKTNNFDFDNELICKLLKRGYKTFDVPIHYYPRSYSEGKHINWKHGFKILWTIIRLRFTN